jgi:phosphopantothenate-cysteine ligase
VRACFKGRRGAVSTEYFLAQGYSVVFLQRKGCISPFARRIQEALESKHLDTKLLSKCGLPDTTNNKTCNWSNPQIDLSLDLGANADPSRKKNVVDAIQKYHAAADAGHLLCVEFESVVEYLFYLKHVSLAFQPLGRRAMIYLAAAVSDFYIPRPSMAQHKIQSREGPLW